MPVYVDDMYKISSGHFRGMKMSHLFADTTEELLVMADKIGLNKNWIQDKGESGEHFDVSMSKRELAVQMGAIEIGMRELCSAVHRREGPNEKIILNKKQ